MKSILGATLVLALLAVGLLPVFAGEVPAADAREDVARQPAPEESTSAVPETPDSTTTTESSLPVDAGIDGPPLVVNGNPISPDRVCRGVDGAVVMDDGDTRYVAGFEGGPFLRVILSDGDILEISDVTFSEDASGGYGLGILQGELPEANITMYLDDGLSPCPELR